MMKWTAVICMELALLALTFGEDNTTIEDDLCQHEPETGMCRASIPAWFYNTTDGECQEFIYGGCPSKSLNRFSNRESCIRKCAQDICQLESDTGPCRAAHKRWHYNPETRRCEEFVYGGCDGTENRFSTQSSCELACAGSSVPCELGDTFSTVGRKAVIEENRQEEWFVVSCERKCRQACLEEHPWGHCLAFSIRRKWYGGCKCYMFDRYLSDLEMDSDTKGITRNRHCKEGGEVFLRRELDNEI